MNTLPVTELLDQIDLYNVRLLELAVAADWTTFNTVRQGRDALLSTLDGALNQAFSTGALSPEIAQQRVLVIQEVNTRLADLADTSRAELEARRVELERAGKALQAYQQGKRHP